ncbi:MAG: hypothetical protein CMD65_03695 [Gammaproteobacteria bacterium]|mgnify:FL=1|nr:hypothetical protein [Gammaproteobacteria bacterium]
MKKARVLLVSPNLKGIVDGITRIQPTMGLLLIAPILEKAGHTVKIYDSALDGWETRKVLDANENIVMIGHSDDEIASVISDFSPDIVAVSVLFSNLIESAHNIARISKQVNSNVPVILGGNHISSSVIDYQHSMNDLTSKLSTVLEDLEDKNIDMAMTGEGEFAFADLVDALINKKDYSHIPGLVKKIGYRKYLINESARLNDLNLLPRPARHLVNMEGYFNIGAFQSTKTQSDRVLSIMCSRGCPEKCTFCSTPQMWGQKVRWRSTEHIMNEVINDSKAYNIGELHIQDDSLTADKKNLYALCDALEKVGLPWCTPNGTKVNYHFKKHDEMYKKMHDSGCYQLTLACESGVQRVLDNVINKRLPLETIYPSIEQAKKAGMLVHTYWILGYPGETYEEMQTTIEFAMKSGADSFTFSILSPLPGTPIYRQVVNENLWWSGRGLDDVILQRESLIKVDGFSSPYEFEKFVRETNKKANLLLKQNDPERFKYKYGSDADETSLIKQS